MTVRIAIDLNVRVSGNQTYASLLDDVDPPGTRLDTEDQVIVYERETSIESAATVTRADYATNLVYLWVDWSGFREPEGAEDDPACE